MLVLFVLVSACGRPEPGPAAKPVHQSRAKSQYDARVFDASLATIVAWHDSVGTGWSAPAGPEPDAVSARFEDLGFTLNDELRTLWSRHTPPDDAPPLVYGYRLLSAEAAREHYDALRADASVPWRPNWVPVLEGDAQWLVVESSRSGAPAGPVVAVRPDEEPVVAFTNLTRLFEAIATALADSTSRWTDETVRIEPDVFRRAHGASNPELQLPAHVTGS